MNEHDHDHDHEPDDEVLRRLRALIDARPDLVQRVLDALRDVLPPDDTAE